MDLCYIFFGCTGVLLTLYLLLELHYFFRTVICVICARISRTRIHILDETKITGICLTTDIDNLLNHMNNARYLRELDFAKIDFNERTGLYRQIRKCGGCLVLGATTIRYRRFIRLFSRYYITTKIIYWDEQSIYMEHRFITPPDNFVNAIVLCKTRLTKCNADQIIKDLLLDPLNKCDIEASKNQKPEMTLELAKWIESNEISSALLRSK